MKTVIGIIGGKGRMGKWFAEFFRRNGFKVLVADKKTKLKAKELCRKSDIVVFSVPINKTVELIERYGKFIRDNSLVCDFTSLKEAPVKAMKKSVSKKVEVVGLHPLFAATAKSLKGQTIIACRERTGKNWAKLAGVFRKAKAKLVFCSPSKQDELMAVVQGITHFSAIATGYALKKLGINLAKSFEFTSPVYRLRLNMVGRILNQDPELYKDIELLNPYTKKTVKKYLESVKELEKIIQKKDSKKFLDYFKKSADFFGNYKKKAMAESDYLIEQMVKK